MTDKDPPILLDTIQENLSFKKGYYNSEKSQPALQNACLCITDTAYNNFFFTARQALFLLLLLLGNSKFLYTSHIGNTFSH